MLTRDECLSLNTFVIIIMRKQWPELSLPNNARFCRSQLHLSTWQLQAEQFDLSHSNARIDHTALEAVLFIAGQPPTGSTSSSSHVLYFNWSRAFFYKKYYTRCFNVIINPFALVKNQLKKKNNMGGDFSLRTLYTRLFLSLKSSLSQFDI